MKRLKLFILLIFAVIDASSQDLHYLQQQVHSAKTLKDKIYALDGIAKYYTWTLGADSLAELYGNQQIQIAFESGKKEFQVLALLLNGVRLIQSVPTEKKFNQAKKYLFNVIKIGKNNNLPYYVASAYTSLSYLHYSNHETDSDLALSWGKDAFKYATTVKNDSLQILSLIAMAVGNNLKNNNVLAFQQYFNALHKAETANNSFLLSYCQRAISKFYYSLKQYNKAIQYLKNAEETIENKINPSYDDLHWLFWIRQNFSSDIYANIGQFDKAKIYAEKSLELAKKHRMTDFFLTQPIIQHYWILINEGNYLKAKEFVNNPKVERFFRLLDWQYWLDYDKALIYWKTNNRDSAAYFFEKAIGTKGIAIQRHIPYMHLDYGQLLFENGNYKKSIQQFEIAKSRSESFKDLNHLAISYKSLENAYNKAGNIPKAYQYSMLFHHFDDSLNQLSKEKDIALLEVEREQRRLEQAQREKQAIAKYHNRIRTFGFISVLAIVLTIAIILWRNNIQKQKANLILQQQKDKTEDALKELKATQAQLIQKEKMASLGELTAGIAHELQNPLNFVNNFSEVNDELLAEILVNIDNGNTSEVKEIAVDIKENNAKIGHHGKRADAIIKSMLQHSKISSGEQELTDLNALVNGYLRLSYLGYKSREKDFHATIETDFDNNIGKINLYTLDIGRVLLNLYNNAFYAVQQKKQHLNGTYEPIIMVATKKRVDRIEIVVGDNGTGIPQQILNKIYQPFFTTKPTGEGTGLGLSLSYDIITKEHGGELKVKTREGEGTEFIIELPMVK